MMRRRNGQLIMRIFRGFDTASRPADANTFVGQARTKLLASDSEGAAVHVYRVEFESGSRTNWPPSLGPAVSLLE